jgi:hypothetical protein
MMQCVGALSAVILVVGPTDQGLPAVRDQEAGEDTPQVVSQSSFEHGWCTVLPL